MGSLGEKLSIYANDSSVSCRCFLVLAIIGLAIIGPLDNFSGIYINWDKLVLFPLQSLLSSTHIAQMG